MSEIRKKIIRRLFFTVWSIITLFALIGIVLMVYKLIQENKPYINSVVNLPSPPLPSNSPQQALHNENINVYVSSKDEKCLLPIEIQIEWKSSYQENCKQVLNSMKTLKIDSYISLIPDDITPRGIYLTPEGELVIDLPALIISKYDSNTTTLHESLLTYAIVNSLLQKELTKDTNVKGVRFLIEGAVPTIEFPKHISWLQIFTPDYSLICNE